MDACDAQQHRAGQQVDLHLPSRRGAGTGQPSLAAVGCLRGTGSRTVGTRNAARSSRPLVLAHAIDPHVPGWRARPYAGGMTARNQEQFQQNVIIRYGLLHSVTRCW